MTPQTENTAGSRAPVCVRMCVCVCACACVCMTSGSSRSSKSTGMARSLVCGGISGRSRLLQLYCQMAQILQFANCSTYYKLQYCRFQISCKKSKEKFKLLRKSHLQRHFSFLSNRFLPPPILLFFCPQKNFPAQLHVRTSLMLV